ncbi:MAG: OmpH family outer membrane protein [Treponemataceae bacterium]
MKKFLFSLSFLFMTFFAMAQEITKVAVVDLRRINENFRVDSQAARDYETKKQKYKAESQKLQEEIVKLKNQRLDAQQKNKDTRTIQKYDALIAAKTKFLVEYTSTKNEELKMLQNKLIANDNFYKSVYNAIKTVAEREGYTVVLNLQDQTSAIIWYSLTIDITDMVITELN